MAQARRGEILWQILKPKDTGRLLTPTARARKSPDSDQGLLGSTALRWEGALGCVTTFSPDTGPRQCQFPANPQLTSEYSSKVAGKPGSLSPTKRLGGPQPGGPCSEQPPGWVCPARTPGSLCCCPFSPGGRTIPDIDSSVPLARHHRSSCA